ncbi:hypothetical protein [Promicromonospora sp. NPDC057488]|uniref:hypothetical protein n=1 Tax=Promicromonospora sp. NPDC057488 TaxID=3346147 RepID=UPI00366CAB09
MPDSVILSELPERSSADPWALYRNEQLAGRRGRVDRDGFYVGMLKSDIRNQRYAYDVSVLPECIDPAMASKALFTLLNDFSQHEYDRNPIGPIISFVDVLLDESVRSGGMLTELSAIAGEMDEGSSLRSRSSAALSLEAGRWPSLAYIPRWSVAKVRGEILQAGADSASARVRIPRERIRPVKLRRANRAKWRRAIKGLRRIDDRELFGEERLAWDGYLFSNHVATQELAVAATTAPIGWDARGTFEKTVTSPYMAYRRLGFAKFWVEVIDDSVDFLNSITRDRSIFGDDAFGFSVVGLPSSSELSAAMGDLRNGLLTVERAHNMFMYPKYAKRREDPAENN